MTGSSTTNFLLSINYFDCALYTEILFKCFCMSTTQYYYFYVVEFLYDIIYMDSVILHHNLYPPQILPLIYRFMTLFITLNLFLHYIFVSMDKR